MSSTLGSFQVDASVRRCGPGGSLLVGGSPRRLIRLTASGAQLFDRVAAGGAPRAARGVRSLVHRLVAAGLLHPTPSPVEIDRADDVSVVVPVRDHSTQLRRLLDSLAASRPAPARVVVVDDGSTVPVVVDRPASGPDTLDVSVLRRDRSGGPAAARNAGVAAVDTAFVALVDADCVVSTDWLAPLLAQLADPAVAVAAPRVRAAISPTPGCLERYDAVASPLDLGPRPARVAPGTRVSYVPSAALLCRVADLEAVGGFDEGLRVGEDVDLVWRLAEAGRWVRYDPRSVVHHEVRAELRAWVAQRVGYGTSAAALDERHPGQVAPVVCSPWSAVVWGLVLLGRYESAAGVALATTERLRRQLQGVPLVEVARLGLGGHAAAGLQLARATLRAWWPVAVGAALLSRRARRWVAVAVVVATVDAARGRSDGPVRPPAAVGVGLGVLDDVAYGGGVWLGALRRRRPGALRPRFAPRRASPG